MSSQSFSTGWNRTHQRPRQVKYKLLLTNPQFRVLKEVAQVWAALKTNEWTKIVDIVTTGYKLVDYDGNDLSPNIPFVRHTFAVASRLMPKEHQEWPPDLTCKITRETIADKAQLEVLKQACDFYTRMFLGQFMEVNNIVRMCRGHDPDFATQSAVLGHVFGRECDIEELMKQASSLFGHSTGSSHGIHSDKVNDKSRIAYDIQQVIRHRLSCDSGLSRQHYTVDSDPPRLSSKRKSSKLPIIEGIP
jgi:hypothetical protein